MTEAILTISTTLHLIGLMTIGYGFYCIGKDLRRWWRDKHSQSRLIRAKIDGLKTEHASLIEQIGKIEESRWAYHRELVGRLERLEEATKDED